MQEFVKSIHEPLFRGRGTARLQLLGTRPATLTIGRSTEWGVVILLGSTVDVLVVALVVVDMEGGVAIGYDKVVYRNKVIQQ